MEEIQQGITGSVLALSAWKKEPRADLAAALGLSPVTIAQKLNGRLAWTLKDIKVLCDHYGVTFDQLTAGPRSWLGLPEGGDDVSGMSPTLRYVPELAGMAA